MKVNEVKSFITPNEELISKLEKAILNKRQTEDEDYSVCKKIQFILNDLNYALIKVAKQPISDEGKYQYGGEIYQLVEFDKTIASYPCEKSITKKFNLFAKENWIRSGSYFSDYCYEYSYPDLFSYEVVTIPAKVIPEHEELKIKDID